MTIRGKRECRDVAIVLAGLRPGGAERVVVHLANGLTRAKVRTSVICVQSTGVLAKDLSPDVSVLALGSTRGYDLKAVFSLAGVLRRMRPLAVNVHDYSSLVYVAAASLLGMQAPIVFTAHGLLYAGFEHIQRRHRLAAKRLSALMAVSEEVADRHREYLGWTGEIPVVRNGVPDLAGTPEARTEARRKLGIRNDATVYLAVGNARPEKAFEDLLDAVALLKSLTESGRLVVLIAGHLTETAYCQGLIKRLHALDLSHAVQFLGYIDDVQSLYSAADAFVVSSRSEGLPMVVLEAMTAGLPVVATRVGGIPRAVAPGTGVLVKAAAPTELAHAMATLLADPDLRHTMGQKARERALAEYGVDRMVAQYLEVYESVADRQRGGRRTPR